jgi:hypothetical protein
MWKGNAICMLAGIPEPAGAEIAMIVAKPIGAANTGAAVARALARLRQCTR